MTCPDPQYTLLTKEKDSRAKEEAKQQNPFSSFNDSQPWQLDMQ